MQETRITLRTGRRRDVIKVSGTTTAQREAWQAAAEAAGMSLSCWLREAADAAALAGMTAADLRAEIIQLRAGLARGVGNNLNQIATALNLDLRARKPVSSAAHEVALVAAARDLAVIRCKAEALLRRLERAGHGRRQ
jgi:hypothetical protein